MGFNLISFLKYTYLQRPNLINEGDNRSDVGCAVNSAGKNRRVCNLVSDSEIVIGTIYRYIPFNPIMNINNTVFTALCRMFILYFVYF